MSHPFFTLFPISGTLYIWKTPKEAYSSKCLVSKVKHKGCSVVVWAAILWNSVGLIITFHGRITARQYGNRLLNQVHPMIQILFPNNDAVLEDDNALTHTAGTVQSRFEEHEGEIQHLPWPAQSHYFNINEPLWSVLETRVRNRFPPSTSLKQLEDVLEEEWYKIPLETVQN
jgi:hypothetical protein